MVKAKYFDELSSREVYEILAARAAVFVADMGMRCLDPDGVDYRALHIFDTDGERVSAYLRAFYADEERLTVSVGRVLTRTHGVGDGRRLMTEAIPLIKEMMGARQIVIHAQCHAAPFYKKFGFTPSSDVFTEEGVEHVEMRLAL